MAEGEEVGVAGLGVRGVSLTMGGMLLWLDLVSVACMGVMKLDCGRGWLPAPGSVWGREEGDAVLLCGVWGRRGLGKPLAARCEGDCRLCGRGGGDVMTRASPALLLLLPLRRPEGGVDTPSLEAGGTRGEAVGGGRGLGCEAAPAPAGEPALAMAAATGL